MASIIIKPVNITLTITRMGKIDMCTLILTITIRTMLIITMTTTIIIIIMNPGKRQSQVRRAILLHTSVASGTLRPLHTTNPNVESS
jgi:hypothetical protein